MHHAQISITEKGLRDSTISENNLSLSNDFISNGLKAREKLLYNHSGSYYLLCCKHQWQPKLFSDVPNVDFSRVLKLKFYEHE